MMTISQSLFLSDDGAGAMEDWIIVEPGSDTILASVQKAACSVEGAVAGRLILIVLIIFFGDGHILLDLFH